MLRDLFSDLRFRFRALFQRADVERELADELQFHIEVETNRLVRTGLSPREAHREARLSLGGVERVKEAMRDARGLGWLDSLAQDLRYALRGLGRSPGFTVAAVVTLALGIGANTALYTILGRFFAHDPTGVSSAEEVQRVVLHSHDERHAEQTITNFNYPEFRDLSRALPPGFQATAYTTDASARLGADRHAMPGVVSYVIGDFFGVLGVRAAAGRVFRDEEVTTHALSKVAIISYRFWRSQLALAPDVVGRQLDVGSHRYTVIGVAPEQFSGIDLEAVDLWVPRNSLGSWDDWSPARIETAMMTNLHVLVRIPATPAAKPQGEVEATSWLRKSGMLRDSTATVTLSSLRTAVDVGFQGTEAQLSVRLSELALLILIITCANVANLLLVRTMHRHREIATRIALGASASRLFVLVTTESLVLSAVGGTAALVCATWLTPVLSHALLPTVHWEFAGLGLGSFLVAMLLILTTGIAIGVIPATHAARADVNRALRGDSGSQGVHRTGIRSVMLATQVALAVVLVASAALLVRSAVNVDAIDTGYETDRVAYAEILPDMTFSGNDAEAFRTVGLQLPRIAERLSGVAGVDGVALSLRPPLRGFAGYRVFLPDRDSVPTLNRMPPLAQIVSPNFFAVAGLHVLDGRSLGSEDQSGAAPVVVVNQLMARTLWPGARALGNCIIVSTRGAPCRTVVGVVADAHYFGIFERPAMQFYMPFAQADTSAYAGAILIRSQPGLLAKTTAAVREAFTGATETWGTPVVRTMDDVLAPIVHPWRLAAELFAGAALLGLIVAAVGIYGTVAYSLRQREYELGVRLALGAPRSGVARLIVFGALRAVGVGMAVGGVLVFALGKVVGSMLYGVTARDPTMFVVVATSILAVAIAACAVPAWKAAHMDPVALLRSE